MKAGWTINNIPKKPKKTADHLFTPTLSDKNIIDAIVTKIGPPKVKETTSAKGSSLKPKNNAIIASAPQIALNAWRPGRDVL